MKKLNILFLPLLLLSTSIQAEDKLYSFIGVQTSTIKYQKVLTQTIGVKYGKQTKDIRTSISYNYGKKSNNNYHTLIMQIDTGVLKNRFKNSALKPYIGASVGVMEHTTNSNKDRGYIYGANAGLTYLLSDVVDLDLGYRFMKTVKLDDIDKINDLTFSMHYFY